MIKIKRKQAREMLNKLVFTINERDGFIDVPSDAVIKKWEEAGYIEKSKLEKIKEELEEMREYYSRSNALNCSISEVIKIIDKYKKAIKELEEKE
jgi:hypothetical protein